MANLSGIAGDERTARIALSMLVEPNNPVTRRILTRLGAVETLWLAERDVVVMGLDPVDAGLAGPLRGAGGKGHRRADRPDSAVRCSCDRPRRR